MRSAILTYYQRLYHSLDRRQRVILGFYMAALPLMIAVLFFSNVFYVNQKKPLIEEYKILEWLSSLPDFDQEKVDAIKRVKEASLTALVIESAGRDSIIVDRIYPKGDAEISCAISTTTFDQFIKWFEKFSQEHPYVSLTYLSINKISPDNPQQISASFTLAL